MRELSQVASSVAGKSVSMPPPVGRSPFVERFFLLDPEGQRVYPALARAPTLRHWPTQAGAAGSMTGFGAVCPGAAQAEAGR